MAFGTYKTFGQIKDEDKYLRFFTKRNIIWTAIGLSISVGVMFLSKAMNASKVGAVVSFIIVVSFAAISFVRIPTDKYLSGGGLFLTTLLQRYFMRRIGKNKVLYCKYHRKDGKSIWL